MFKAQTGFHTPFFLLPTWCHFFFCMWIRTKTCWVSQTLEPPGSSAEQLLPLINVFPSHAPVDWTSKNAFMKCADTLAWVCLPLTGLPLSSWRWLCCMWHWGWSIHNFNLVGKDWRERESLAYSPGLSVFSEHQINSNTRFHDQHMYLLILTEEGWLFPLMHTFLFNLNNAVIL